MDFTSEHKKSAVPGIQMAPLIDIVFLLLIFFMSVSIFYQLETEIDITVPKAEQSEQMTRAPGEIIINITRKGNIVVNQRRMSVQTLSQTLKRISELYTGQPVIIRADRKTYHQDVIQVLDICAQAGIWNVSFATMEQDQEEGEK